SPRMHIGWKSQGYAYTPGAVSWTKKVLPLASSPESNLAAPVGTSVAVAVCGDSSWFFHWTKVPALIVTFEDRKFLPLSNETPNGMSMHVAVGLGQTMGLGLAGKTST